ncbi:MAG: glutamine amidotransferase [Candidatus Omnitrophota bacterium]|jgi:glutamine amidotransferase
MIALIDYGMGNLRSVQKALEHTGLQVKTTSDVSVMRKSKAIVLPGVGSFQAAMAELKKNKLDQEIIKSIKDGKPYLGFCLGLQLLFDTSDEGHASGLGVFPGKVLRFPNWMKVPHMGWNQVNYKKDNPLNQSMQLADEYYYFVHSYFVAPTLNDICLATSTYGQEFVTAIMTKNVIATQFHPEKSQIVGLNFLEAAAKHLGLK